MKARLCVALAAFLAPHPPAADPVTRPKAVLVIRHAEKPADDGDIHLSPAGKRRAEALPGLFVKSSARPAPLPEPDFVFAAARSKHSDRSAETVTPLAKALKLEVNKAFDRDDYKRLAKELLTGPKYAGKTVLVCWHHGKIPELAERLGVAPRPKDWEDSVFDRVWVVTFDGEGKAKPVDTLPQALMPGDAK